MKKILAAILAVAMVMSFAACGSSSSSKSDSSSKSSSSSKADSSSSSAADSSSTADSSAAESSSAAEGTTADASTVKGAWTITGGKKGDADITLEAIAEEMKTTVDKIQGTTVFNDDGSYVAYSEGKIEKGTYTVSGNKMTVKDEKGETTEFTYDGETLIYQFDPNIQLLMKSNPSFTPPAEGQQTEATEAQQTEAQEQQTEAQEQQTEAQEQAAE